MRLIDADVLKECAIPCEIHNGALTDLCVPLYQIDNASTVEYPFERFRTMLCGTCQAYMRIESERPQGKWIPVSERLPEFTGLYLISVDDVVTVANFTGTYFMHRGGGRVKVYAWQPLPEPYRDGGAE